MSIEIKKVKYILIIAFLCILTEARCQNVDNGIFLGKRKQIKICFPIKNDFGNNNVKKIYLFFHKKEPSFIKVHIVNLTKNIEKNEYYDLGFEGDIFMLKQKYPKIPSPLLPVISGQNVYGTKDTTRLFNISSASIYPDSTVLVYNEGFEEEIEHTYWGVPVKYESSISEIENKIAKQILEFKEDTIADSVVVFEAIVSKEREFKLIGLIGGTPSRFSNIVQKIFQEKATNYFQNGQSKWRAAIEYNNGRSIESKIKIYARLNENGSVSIKLPKTLRNFTGD